MHNRHTQMYMLLWITPVAMAITLFLLNTFLADWRWANDPVHASVEAIGGIAAVMLGLFLYQRERDEYSGEMALVANGLICMGLLDTIHGFLLPGAAFVFLHSMASFVGGAWFALIWLPRTMLLAQFADRHWIPWTAALASILFGAFVVWRADLLPAMSYEGNFTTVATSINVLAGIFFLIAVPRFISNDKHAPKAEFFLFFCLALLFGLSELTFKFSSLWDAGWWLWHFVRLLAYLIALWFLGQGYVQMAREQKRIEEEIRQHRDNLERVIEERTAVLEERTNALKINQETLQMAVQAYSQFAERVAQGNLSARVTLKDNGNNDLDLLTKNLNRMVEKLSMMTQQIREAATNIASAAAEILSAASQQASSAAQQSSAITEATTTVDEIKRISRQTAQQAGQLAQESQAVLAIAKKGTQTVEETINGMGHIRQRVESIAQTILALSEQTQAIGAITTSVSEIADQSNMLALNAAIEAARAGEQGKSFAVVAQNVRELAERSKSATAQVQEILGEIQRATNVAVMVTEEGTKGVEAGAKQAGDAGQVIHQITREVEHSSQANTQMAAAAHQQTAGMDQIGQAMQAIQQATKESLSSTRQAETAARDLHVLAKRLQDIVSTYKM